MISVSILGTSGMTPLPNRHLSSCVFRHDGVQFLIDCGEGTQVALKEAGYSLKKIDYILLTHYHTDHVGGLAGLLASMANSEKDNTVTIIGPKGLNRVVNAVKSLVSKLPFTIKTIEIVDEDVVLELNGLKITPFSVEHKIPCFGYKVILPREGKCLPEKAASNDVPIEIWSELQHNKVVERDGRIFTKDLIMTDARKEIKFVYTTDTRPCNNIVEAAKNADLFVCEGMYGDYEQITKAKKNYHMMMQEAAEIASKAGPAKLVLTHYSPSMVKPEQYLSELRYVFNKVEMGYDGYTVELDYEK
jgi:ribonuclease Z